MKTVMFVATAFAILSGSAFADPIADRKAIMKERGGLVGGLAKVAKGETPFDAAAVMTALESLDTNAKAFNVDTLFPAGSDTGDTKASPQIWQDMAGFKASADKYAADVAAAVAAKPADLAAFQTQFGAITSNCGGCHKAWRL